MIQDAQNTNRPLALILTLVFHGLLILLLFLIVLKTPIPPYPLVGGGSGLEVNFGTSDQGTGNVQPEELIPIETQNMPDVKSNEKANVQVKNNPDENVLTQNTEDAPAVRTSDKKEVKKPEVKQVIKINDPVTNPMALYKKKTGTKGGSEGETGKAGDQGNPQGSLYAKNHYGEPGSGGEGNGGNGIGTGRGDGRGPSFDLRGRSSKVLPKPEYNLSEQGTVVVKIWVDKDGNVIKAEAGAKGTTTTSEELRKRAVSAARKAKFSPNVNAAEEQTGTITYHFVLQN
jgi:TonB family protein